MNACGYCRMFLTNGVSELLVDLLPVQNVVTLVRKSGGGLARCPEQGNQIVFELVRGHSSEMGCYGIGGEFYTICHR